jgi:hypothetical protein
MYALLRGLKTNGSGLMKIAGRDWLTFTLGYSMAASELLV